MISLVLALLVAAQASAAPQPQRADTRTWYQAYADAQQKIQQRNWQGALNDLDAAARLGAPRPGKNVLLYGDRYGDYIPDYYRGVALSNLERYEEADQAFERVRQAQLIGTRDTLYRSFTQQAGNAKDMAAKSVAARQAAQQNAAVRQQGVPPTGVNPALANTAGINAANVSAANANAPGVNPANVPPQGVSTQGVVTPGVNTQGVATPPLNAVVTPEQQKAADAAAARARVGTSPAANARATLAARTTPNPPPQVQASTSSRNGTDEAASLLLYFNGDYAAAFAALTKLAADPSASRRTYFYLACSRAAMVLVGQAPRTAGAEARQFLAEAGSVRQFDRDLSLISPRVRQELGIQP